MTTKNTEQWQVQRGDGKCAGSGKVFQPGEEYYAALIETENGFERRDFDCQYWQQEKPQVFCFWKTRVPVKKEKKLLVDNDILINIFERLENEQEQVKINFRFVLALILMRKRILKYEDSYRAGDREIWKMRFTRESDIHEVINPQLNDAQIEQVSQELSTILHGELQ